jgi:hypothetical protein
MSCLPERGRIGIFKRSYYEEVLIVRAHPESLRSQRLPDGPLDQKTIRQVRYRSIVGLEATASTGCKKAADLSRAAFSAPTGARIECFRLSIFKRAYPIEADRSFAQ